MSAKVMIVEDESIVAMELSSYVKNLGYEVVGRVSNAEDACEMFAKYIPSIILMDVHIKGDIDGITLAQEIQKKKETAIIYITAFNDDESIERAVSTNPAAYLAKPFNRKELAASLKIALMRTKDMVQKEQKGAIIINDEFSYNPETQELLCCGNYVHLTRKETEFLALLLEANQQVVDIYTMENRLWPEKPPNENTRRSLVSRLRVKLKYQFIETLAGYGYRFRF